MVKAYIHLIAQHKAQANADIIHEKLSASVMHMSRCNAQNDMYTKMQKEAKKKEKKS